LKDIKKDGRSWEETQKMDYRHEKGNTDNSMPIYQCIMVEKGERRSENMPHFS
jgi:hypothetical protein